MYRSLYQGVGPGHTQLKLPSGDLFQLPAGQVVIGDYFTRFVATGLLQPAPEMTEEELKRRVRNPLKVDLDSYRLPKSPVAVQVGVVDQAAQAATETPRTGGSTEIQVPTLGVGADPTLLRGDKYEGKTREEWASWLRESADGTILQMKLSTLKDLAAILGIPILEETKLKVLSALKEHVRG